MADTTEQQNSPLINELLTRGHEFSFDQVMRLISSVLGEENDEGLLSVPLHRRIRIRPDLSLAFPAADVAKVERTGKNNADFLITTTFLGLYGASSPLPIFYTEDLMDEAAADSSASRDFIDILHQPMYQLCYQLRNKYRLYSRAADANNDADRERLFCLIGLGERELRDSVPDAWSLLRYAGLISRHTRSAAGLQTLLRDALEVKKLSIEQCILRTVPIPDDQLTRLGVSNIRLGIDAMLGTEVKDRMGKFRIHIGPLSLEDYNSFLPDTPRFAKLALLTRLYVTDPLDYDLRLILAANQAKPIRFGDPNTARLGWNSWCFSGETLGEVSAIFPIPKNFPRPPVPVEAPAPKRPQATTLVEFYQQELAVLRDLAMQYAEEHPELASMISSHRIDPGIERLFEMVAFLNGLLRMKLADDFPEVIHDVIAAIQPNYLRPIPATTIIVFSPRANCTGTQMIPDGTELKSAQVDGTACRFTTRYPVEIHPLALTDATFAHPPGQAPVITLGMKLTGMTLANWQLSKLRLFLSGEYQQTTNLYLVLMRYVKRIVIVPVDTQIPFILESSNLSAVGFETSELLFPGAELQSPTSEIQLLHEYFLQPNRFLFFDLNGFDKWQVRGDGAELEIRFELEKLPFELGKVTSANFALFATPAANLFPHNAVPIILTDIETEYPVTPAENTHKQFQLYSVETVVGTLNKPIQQVICSPGRHFHLDDQSPPEYHVTYKASYFSQDIETFISVRLPPFKGSRQCTDISVNLLCTNGEISKKLTIGDICVKTDTSPVFATFSNCLPVTGTASCTFENNQHWQLLSLRNINLSLLTFKSLRAILRRILQTYNRDSATVKRYLKQIEAISDLHIKVANRIMAGKMRQGWEIRIKLDSEAFCSLGDMFLFGSLLDIFLRGYTSKLFFTRTFVEDKKSGVILDWPVKLGTKSIM